MRFSLDFEQGTFRTHQRIRVRRSPVIIVQSMGRPRTLDPANLPPSPNPTTDPARERELVDELQKRLRYIEANYSFCKETSEGRQSFNESIETIARSLRRKRRSSLELKRVHPAIETEISRRAKLLAEAQSRDVNQADINAAAEDLIAAVKKLRGRPRNEYLHKHVAGVIALLQQFIGKPVIAHRFRNSDYDPHFVDGISQAVPLIFGQIDPEVTLTTLVEHAIAIREEYAGKQLDFLDLFPAYVLYVDDEDELRAGLGFEVEAFEKNIPLYSR